MGSTPLHRSARRLAAVFAIVLCSVINAAAQSDTDPIYGKWDLLPSDSGSVFGETMNDCTTLPRVAYGFPPYDAPRVWYWLPPDTLFTDLSPTAFNQTLPPESSFPAAVPLVVTESGGMGSTSFSFAMVNMPSLVLEGGTATATTEVTFSDMSILPGWTQATVTFLTTVTGCTTCPQDPLEAWYAPIPCTRQQVFRGTHTWDSVDPPFPPPPTPRDGDCAEVKRVTGRVVRGELRCRVIGKRGRKVSGRAVRFEVLRPGESDFTMASTAASDAKGKAAFSLAGRSVGDRVRCSADGCVEGVIVSSRPRVVRRVPQ